MLNPVTFGLWRLEPRAATDVRAASDVNVLQRALARGDTTRIRRHGDSVRASVDAESGLRRGDADLLYQEALVLLAVGDTAAALVMLDDVLEELAAGPRWLIEDVHRAAAIGLTMRLRALLAAAAGDESAARAWADRTRTLWRSADTEIRPLLEPLRGMVQPQ
jgi:hypothetical protein